MDIANTDKEGRPAVDAGTGAESDRRKRQKTQHAVSDNMQVASNMTANLMLTPASRHQDTQQCALLRLPQELQDMIFAYVYGGRELKLHVRRDKGTKKYVFEDSESSNESAKKGTLSVVPALAQTCQQLRWTSKLYFELNKLWIGLDFPLHFQDEGPQGMQALARLTESLPSVQRDAIKKIHLAFADNINDLIHAISTYWSVMPPRNINRSWPHQYKAYPLASMKGLEKVTIYVSRSAQWQTFIPAAVAMLGISPGVDVEFKSRKMVSYF